MKFLKEIRNKDNSEKKQFAFTVAFFITLLIFIVWSIATFYTFDLSEAVEETKAATSPIKSIISSFKSLF